MCRAVTCKHCQKMSWAGCGMHVEQVLAGVPRSQRCEGHPELRGTGLMSRLRARLRGE